MIDVPAAWVKDTKAGAPARGQGAANMATRSRRVGPPTAVVSGIPPRQAGHHFPPPRRAENQQPPGFEPVTHGTIRGSLIVVVSLL